MPKKGLPRCKECNNSTWIPLHQPVHGGTNKIKCNYCGHQTSTRSRKSGSRLDEMWEAVRLVQLIKDQPNEGSVS